MQPLYINEQANAFLKTEFESEFNEYYLKINKILANSKDNYSFIKYRNYAITNISTIYNYYLYINWLNKYKIPINCLEVLF